MIAKKEAARLAPTRQLQRNITKTIILTSAILSILISPAALADNREPDPAPAVVIDMAVIPTPTPSPAPTPLPEEIREHDLDEADVDTLSRLLWSSPLRSEEYKRDLIAVVLNRSDLGGIYGNSIQAAVNLSEFAFFDKTAHLSKENDRIVRDELNRWLSRKDGCNVPRRIPADCVYIRFSGDNNRILEVTAERGGAAYKVS